MLRPVLGRHLAADNEAYHSGSRTESWPHTALPLLFRRWKQPLAAKEASPNLFEFSQLSFVAIVVKIVVSSVLLMRRLSCAMCNVNVGKCYFFFGLFAGEKKRGGGCVCVKK
jgi:hypothetical protein